MNGVVLINPHYDFNVGGSLRACAAFDVDILRWTGQRVPTKDEFRNLGRRLPREERMRGYKDHVDFDRADQGIITQLKHDHDLVPVAVEVRNSSESLITFDHPENAMYVFGPEDGSLTRGVLTVCHRFVHIPTHFCLNLAAAVNVVLYDRRAKAQLYGREPMLPLDEMLVQERRYS